MGDLISRSSLFEKVNKIEIQHFVDHKGRFRPLVKTIKILNCIEDEPTVDAKPVVYGEWIPQDETFTKFMCNQCKAKNYSGGDNFCPNCGADMKGKNDD